jgi:hypothetical protein
MTVFWDAAICSLVEIYRRLRGDGPDEGSKHIWNDGTFIPDYRVKISEDWPLWEREILFFTLAPAGAG